MLDPARNTVCVKLEDARLGETVRDALAGGLFGVTADMPPEGGRVAILVVDSAHAGLLDHLAESTQSILIADDQSHDRADFVLPADVDRAILHSVVSAAADFCEQVETLRSDVSRRQSAVGNIISGHFAFRTLDEARNLATMLALACPNSDLVVIGLQELLINAVEHGNLEITGEEKQDLIMEGRWRDEVERRLAADEYADRVVEVSFQRGERLIAITIQDDGAGFDFARQESEKGPVEGYRGRGIAMARDMSFSSVAYLGRGNVVEATILLDQPGAD
ncbi:ATP-binding protein [Maricaulis sp.]|uniref:ATP-binding protein n=1 Tax=Maricaulis sp. TaxID=1486257 RepID=UPI0026175A4A|nr:ATP-binding protein [Maricaulis sp.]